VREIGIERMTAKRARGATILAVAVLAAGAIAAAYGISSRARAMDDLTRETRELTVTTVAVTKPSRGPAAEDVVLPGNIQAYTDAAIFARTTGYLKRRLADIGSRVTAGQVLAEIDTPEIDQQLMQARADLGTAQANAHLAQTTADRYQDLIKSDSVSRQDYDTAVGTFEARKAAVESANANVKRLEEMQKFKTIYAPFDGVITARSTDIGALIGGSGGTARELFHIASMERVRIYVNVPQLYSRAAQPGVTAGVEIRELPGKRFAGKIVRTAQALDPVSRTLLVELALDNKTGELLPGSFAEVHLKLPTDATALRLPVSTLMFRSEGLRVATVKGDRVQLREVTMGRDFGSSVEVLAGLTADDLVVINPPDSLADGQTVQISQPAAREQR
jgi:RND family efflux transporter MFP subunit